MASAPAAAAAAAAANQREPADKAAEGKESLEVTGAATARRRSMENGGPPEGSKKLERAQSAGSRRRGRLGLVRSLESGGAPTSGGEPAATATPKPAQLFSLRQLAQRHQLSRKRPSATPDARTAPAGTFARLLELASSSQDSQSSSGSSGENSSGSEERAGTGGHRRSEPAWCNRTRVEEEEDDDDDYQDDSEDDYEEEDELSEEEEEAAGEPQAGGRPRRRRQRRASGCPCLPVASYIGRHGLPVTDVDLASYKDLCQLRHLRAGPRRAPAAGPRLDPSRALGPARRASLQEESGAYYQLCTGQEEQAIRARFLWFPPSLGQLRQVELFFAGFPRDKVPAAAGAPPSREGGGPGAAPGAYRDEQISFQLPRQDMGLDYCSYPMDESARRAYLQFVDRRNSQALDVASVLEVGAAGLAERRPSSSSRPAAAAAEPGAGLEQPQQQQQRCRRCLVRLEPGQLAVVAPSFVIGSAPYRAPAGAPHEPEPVAGLLHRAALFHPTCFTCSTCKEFLVDLVYCLRDNKLYCVRHYGESLRPRCAWCQELIFSEEYLKAMNESFHVDHFLCRHCDSNLAGQRYVLKEEKPFCIRCYETNFAHTCESCRKTIGIDSRDLSYKERHWHDACFVCNKCHQPLIDKPFGSKADKVYCADCYDVTFAARCDGCKNPFRSGSKKMEYKGRQWHDSCFCCCVCLNTIGSNSFIPKNDEIYCIKCYENKYATRCTKCRQVIVSGGVTFRNEPWHRECFNCCNCNKSLAGQRFTTRDVANETVKNTNRTNQPHNAYCIDCYGDLFAKKCYACSQAITGLGGTRFVTFEDRSWHNSCFVCNLCQDSLVGKGFLTDGPDSIVCGECARAKLR